MLDVLASNTRSKNRIIGTQYCTIKGATLGEGSRALETFSMGGSVERAIRETVQEHVTENNSISTEELMEVRFWNDHKDSKPHKISPQNLALAAKLAFKGIISDATCFGQVWKSCISK
jgi:hypothetical protein